MDLNLADDKANAVLQTWYPGARGGKAVADILFGEISPSGKLPITIYRNLQGMPDFDDYSMKNRTYRFVEKAPLYPFGYGLNYADTQIVEVRLISDVDYAQTKEQSVYVEVRAVNYGAVPTEDILQAYVQVEDAKSFTVVDEEGRSVHTGLGADIYIGFGQPDERTRELSGKKSVRLHI